FGLGSAELMGTVGCLERAGGGGRRARRAAGGGRGGRRGGGGGGGGGRARGVRRGADPDWGQPLLRRKERRLAAGPWEPCTLPVSCAPSALACAPRLRSRASRNLRFTSSISALGADVAESAGAGLAGAGSAGAAPAGVADDWAGGAL